MSNNPPYSVVELTKEQHEFLVKNCDVNIAQGLTFLQSVSVDTARKLVDNIEFFKSIRKSLDEAEKREV